MATAVRKIRLLGVEQHHCSTCADHREFRVYESRRKRSWLRVRADARRSMQCVACLWKVQLP